MQNISTINQINKRIMTTEQAKQELAQSLSIEEIEQLMNQLTNYCTRLEIPYSTDQLYETMTRFDRLCKVVSKPHALLIFDTLMTTAYQNDLSVHWNWICEELEYEELIYGLTKSDSPFLNHKGMARASLDVRPADEISDEILDQYNERIERYEKYPDIYSGYSRS